MNDYAGYCLEDFVLDARFQRWVRYQDADDAAFWTTYVREFPAQEEDILHAQALLQSVYRRYESRLSDGEIRNEIQKLILQARESKEPEVSSPEIPKIKKLYASRLLRAASVFLLLGIGWWLWSRPSPEGAGDRRFAGPSFVERQNQTPANELIRLADGTRVTLSPNARISYPAQFAADRRQIYLSGTAFFQVTRDAKRPFVVYTKELVTKVLGTSFLIRATDGSPQTTVEVKEGRVSVSQASDRRAGQAGSELSGLIVTTNQKVIFERDRDRLVKTLRDNPEMVVSSENTPTFQFTNKPVSDVLTELEQVYGVDILFDKDVMRHCPLTATLSDQSLYEKLTVICEAIGARYEVLDGQIVIDSKGCN